MEVVVTGANGFIGSRLSAALLAPDSKVQVSRLLLTDLRAPTVGAGDARVVRRAADLTAPGCIEQLITASTSIVFHLAAVVSGHAEKEFDVGMRANLDVTRELLEVMKKRAPGSRLVFASTCGVFGGELPDVVDDRTAPTPACSYGVAKAMSELLVEEYSRRGWVDGRVLRLPTVSVRAGAANAAVTSFASGIIREPLAGQPAVCPVPLDTGVWLTSPRAVVSNFVHAAALPAEALGARRTLSLPGRTETPRSMLAALARVAGAEAAARVSLEEDESITKIVSSFPSRFDCSRALALGFVSHGTFEDVIKEYIQDEVSTQA